jgi:hypothetical protein
MEAGPSTKPEEIDGKVYAMSLAGIYTHEDTLLKAASDDSLKEMDRLFATQAAVCNEWNGPFPLRDLAVWLQETHLDKRLILATTNWDNDPSFPHLPSTMRKLSFTLAGARPESALVFAVDKSLTFKQAELVLKDPSHTPVGQGPIVYDLKPADVYPGTIIAPGE